MAMDDSTAGMAATIAPKPIPREIQALSNQVTDLDVALDRLFERVQPAVGPEYGGPTDVEMKSPTDEKSEMANSIYYETNRLRELTHTIQRITERIEL